MDLPQLFCASCQEMSPGLFRSIEPQFKPFSGFLENQTYRPLPSIKQSAEAGCWICIRIIESLSSVRLHDDLVVCLTAKPGPQGVLVYHLSYSTPEHQDIRFRQAFSWINHCVQNHPNCALRAHHQEPFLPTRLIDLGLSKPGSEPRLLVTDGCVLKDRRYIALSHSWGLNMPHSAMTLRNNISLRLQNIHEASLPLSFRDAFRFARSIGVNYVWIDSLCIIQDSKDDWRQESATMNKVYTHSWCTLAVAYQNTTNSRSLESSVLLSCRYLASTKYPGLIEYPPKNQNPQTTALMYSNTFWQLFKMWVESEVWVPINHDKSRAELMQQRLDWIDALNSILLHRRGWTLQERELSPRVFHLSPATILWECRSLRASEKLPKGFSDHGALWHGILGELTPDSRYRLLDMYETRKEPMTFGIVLTLKFRNNNDDAYNSWLRAVVDYSKRNLTFCSDRFPAISGLALEIQALTGSDYIAGLWHGDFFRGLLWRSGITTLENHRGLDHLPKASFGEILYYPVREDKSLCFAPSWSWAAFPGPISYDIVNALLSGTGRDEEDARLPKILEVHISTVGSKYGAALLEGAFILLSGRLQPLSQLRKVCHSDKFEISYDTGSDISEGVVFVLLVRFTDRNYGGFSGHGYGLALKRTGKGVEEYKRVGVVIGIELSAFDDTKDEIFKFI